MKEKYPLNFVHKLLGIGLIIIGLFCFMQPNGYHDEFRYGAEGTGFSFVQAGNYVIDVHYKDIVAGNTLIVFSYDEISNDNQSGVTYVEADIVEGTGKTGVMLELEQDVHFLRFRTALDTPENSYIEKVEIQGLQLLNKDHYLLGLLCVLSAVVVLVLGRYCSPEQYKEPAMLIVFSLLASLPLFSDFLLGGDDLAFHIGRLEAVYQGLKAGEFPVYVGSNQMGGFGMLSGTMYPQLFLYPVAILRFFGVSLMLCYKLLVVGMNIATAFTAYYSAKYMCKSAAIGCWTSIFFTFSIYRLTNIYSRAALGEALAMVFLPLIIWGVYEILWGNTKKWYILAIGVSGMLQSHVLSVEMCVLFMMAELLVWLFSRRKELFWQRILAGIKATGVTILLNAFFLYPFLYFCGEDLQCFNMPNNVGETALYFSQMFSLFAPGEGVDLALGSTAGEMPHTVGIVLFVGAVFMCAEAFRDVEKRNELMIGKRCLIYGIAALIMSSWLFPWEQLQSVEWMYTIVTSIQFAWRFLGPASVLLSVVAAIGIVSYARQQEGKWIYALCAALVLCSTFYYFDMKGTVSAAHTNGMNFNGYGSTDAMYMYSDGEGFKALNLEYTRPDAYVRTWYGTEVKYSGFQRQGMQLWVTIDAPENIEDYVVFPIYYYPGYRVLINGEEVEIMNLDSLVACKLPGGHSELSLRYQGVPGVQVANFISIASLIGLLGYYLFVYIKCTKVY